MIFVNITIYITQVTVRVNSQGLKCLKNIAKLASYYLSIIADNDLAVLARKRGEAMWLKSALI